MRRSGYILIVLLVFDVWYRAHTFGPTIRQSTGINLWPANVGASEPLDCDESAYAYIGHRLLRGDVMYRDLTENKPPLGYWMYAAGVAIGGYRELAIRVLPLPAILATIAMIWKIATRVGSPRAGFVGSFLYVLLSTDPYLFGNGSNLEHFMNLFSVASLAAFVGSWDRESRVGMMVAGGMLGAAVLVKQVAILPLATLVPALLFRPGAGEVPRMWGKRMEDVLAFLSGLAMPIVLTAAILVMQGAGRDAYEDIFKYGPALATDTAPEPNAPSGWIRWLTGNADPTGRLPWPFGTTKYLVWWGTGSWPLWLAGVPCVLGLLVTPGSPWLHRVLAAWTLTAVGEVIMPGLYWQHYYLVPTPGLALLLAVSIGLLVDRARRRDGSIIGRLTATVGAGLIVLAIFGTVVIQVHSYLVVPPEELTVRYKGGGQWVVLRSLARELSQRSTIVPDPGLYIWGWQAPLHFYGRLDSPTRHFFVDNLLRDQAGKDHPLIRPRIAEIMRTLRERAPLLVFTGYPPFPELRRYLYEAYLPSRLVPAPGAAPLWVRKKDYADFEGFEASPRAAR